MCVRVYILFSYTLLVVICTMKKKSKEEVQLLFYIFRGKKVAFNSNFSYLGSALTF